MTKDEALKMAIEVLNEHEPDWECNHGYHHNQCPNVNCECKEKKYWKTLDACKEAVKSHFEIGIKSDLGKDFVYTYRLLPDKDGLYWMLQSDLKEALEQPTTQEPYAWVMVNRNPDHQDIYLLPTKPTREQKISHQPYELYTHPPKEWNGLTAEEINSIPLNENTVQAVENILRSKKTLSIDVGIKTWNEKHRKEAIQACEEALNEEQSSKPTIRSFIEFVIAGIIIFVGMYLMLTAGS